MKTVCVENDVEQQNYILINLMSTLSSRSPQICCVLLLFTTKVKQDIYNADIEYAYMLNIMCIYIYVDKLHGGTYRYFIISQIHYPTFFCHNIY